MRDKIQRFKVVIAAAVENIFQLFRLVFIVLGFKPDLLEVDFWVVLNSIKLEKTVKKERDLVENGIADSKT